MEFPKQSIELARGIAERYRKRSRSKKDLAASLFCGDFLEIHYGFTESIREGNCGRYLHEIKKEADCFTMGGVLYLVAKELGLNPELYWASGMKDIKEGSNPEDSMIMDHTFITALVGKNERRLIDPFMTLYGRVKFNPERNNITVYNKHEREVTVRTYGSLKKMTQDEYLEKLEENRSPEGGRIALAATQRINAANNTQIFATYLPKTQEIRSSICSSIVRFGPEVIDKDRAINLTTRVEDNGEFDFKKGYLSFFNVASMNWQDNKDEQLPLVFPAQEALNLWEIWDKIFLNSGRKSRVNEQHSLKLEYMLKDMGFQDDFTITPGSLAERTIDSSLEGKLVSIQTSQKKSVDDFYRICKEDEITYRSILRASQYLKEIEGRKTKENPEGFLFSEQEHENIIREAIARHVREAAAFLRTSIKAMKVRTKLDLGRVYNQDRKVSRSIEQTKENVKYLGYISALRDSKFPLGFNMAADYHLFKNRFDVLKISIQDLEKGLSEEDIKRTIQKRLYERILESYSGRDALFLASFQKGLRRILDRTS